MQNKPIPKGMPVQRPPKVTVQPRSGTPTPTPTPTPDGLKDAPPAPPPLCLTEAQKATLRNALAPDAQTLVDERVTTGLAKLLNKAVAEGAGLFGQTKDGKNRKCQKNVLERWKEANADALAGNNDKETLLLWDIHKAYVLQRDADNKRNALTDGININTAETAQFEYLDLAPDIITDILEARTKVGLFTSIEDLLKIRYLGKSTMTRIRPFLRLSDVIPFATAVPSYTVHNTVNHREHQSMLSPESPWQVPINKDSKSASTTTPRSSQLARTDASSKVQNFIGICRSTVKTGQMWFDTGCRRNVSGPDGHFNMQKALETHGLTPIRHECREEFVFGDGETSVSEYSYEYPVFMKGKVVGTIDIALIKVPCPPLFSLGSAKAWKCKTDHEYGFVYIKEFDRKIPFEDTPLINILEFGKTVDKAKVPEPFHLDQKTRR